MSCIFCAAEDNINDIEHIVNESLVNCHYTLDVGNICKKCNNNFSSFENKALTQSIIGMERARLGITTKRGKAAKSKTGVIEFEGDEEFRKNYITITGLEKTEITNIDPIRRTFSFKVESFNKSEAATAKFLLKMGFESILQSQRRVFAKYDFSELKDHLLLKNNKDWPFIVTQVKVKHFRSIVKANDKYRLNKNHCELLFFPKDTLTLLFKFKYGAFTGITNLLNRHTDWIKEFYIKDPIIGVYPENIKKKIIKESGAQISNEDINTSTSHDPTTNQRRDQQDH